MELFGCVLRIDKKKHFGDLCNVLANGEANFNGVGGGCFLNDNRLKNKYLNWRTIYEGCFMTNEYSDGKTKSLHVVCLPNERKVLTKIGDKNCKFADV